MKNAFLDEYETKRALAEFIIQARRLSMDTKCFEFERAFARYQESLDAVLFNSRGSANLAIHQSLKNLGRLKDGDKIGFSALTWSTNTMPIIQMSMIPVPVDCSAKTLNVMSETLLSRLEETDLQAMFITNALGFAGDMANIRKVCDDRGIILIEDNCEALGTILPEGRTGNFGVASSFSFFVAHHMSTIEGGMVCSSDDELTEMLRIVRANGWDRNLRSNQQHKWRAKFGVRSEFAAKYTFYDLGYNLRPTEITGFLGLVQLKALHENLKKRESNHLQIEAVIKENRDLLPIDHSHINFLSSFATPILCRTAELRKDYIAQFSGAGIEVRPMISGNIQVQPFYSKYVKQKYALPETEFIHNCGFYCGNYPELNEMDIETIVSCLLPKETGTIR